MTVVNKIGGSCLKSVDDYQKIQYIITDTPCILVVSATYGTTQCLLDCLRLASAQKDYILKFSAIIDLHCAHNASINQDELVNRSFHQDKEDILAMLHSVSLLGSYSEQQMDWLLGYGEYWSSKIIASMLRMPLIDSGQIITVNVQGDVVRIDWPETKKRLTKAMKGLNSPVIVMPGFVARNSQGKRALLGFNGSDYTAAVIANVIKATHFYKWTDIDGIYTADPKLVKSAFAIPELSYQEAAELAYFGASVLHPQSVQPAIEANIPIHIKNFFKIERAGTTVCANPTKTNLVVKGLSSISELALINIEGTGLMGLCGFAARLFGCLSRGNISVILISQASSEHSISLVIKDAFGTDAIDMIQNELRVELDNEVVQNIELKRHCTVVSAVGDGMSGAPGVAAKFFQMLSKENINILAIAQGSSERNISVVIDSHNTQRALQVLHGGFYLSSKTLSIGLIGPGGVGAELLDQIKKNRLRLQRELNVNLKIRGIMNSTQMLLNEKNSELGDWRYSLKTQAVAKNMMDFIQHITNPEFPHAVIIDCTSSADVAAEYETMITHSCHLVTPNKKANSSDLSAYIQLKSLIIEHHRHYLYETTVCAGLPVIRTIQDLLATGDRIKRIEGVVSGTLSYIFHQCAQGFSFAESVLQAYELGYTEPDPRDDLNGLDVARKFVCLARELGYALSLSEVTLLNMVPDALKNETIPDFLKKLKDHQQPIEQMIKQLLLGHVAIAYVGVIEAGKITIALNAYAAAHPFANTSGTDNILLIQSRRYDKQPLIIQGPGAGKDVTAAGVFADLLKLASMI